MHVVLNRGRVNQIHWKGDWKSDESEPYGNDTAFSSLLS